MLTVANSILGKAAIIKVSRVSGNLPLAGQVRLVSPPYIGGLLTNPNPEPEKGEEMLKFSNSNDYCFGSRTAPQSLPAQVLDLAGNIALVDSLLNENRYQ